MTDNKEHMAFEVWAKQNVEGAYFDRLLGDGRYKNHIVYAAYKAWQAAIAMCQDDLLPNGKNMAEYVKKSKNITDREESHDTESQGEEVGEWQLVETAPENVRILLSTERGHIIIDFWGDYKEINQPKFTHWMPLPSAPDTRASSTTNQEK